MFILVLWFMMYLPCHVIRTSRVRVTVNIDVLLCLSDQNTMNRSQQAADKSNEILESVKEYYGKVLKKAADLKTDACCTAKYRMVKSTKEALALVHDDVVSR